MPTNKNSARGNRYKVKTRDWFREKGFQVEYLEKLQSIFTKKGMFYKKNDMFGSDGVAMNDKEVIFWNSKVTLLMNKGVSNVTSAGWKEFDRFVWPPFVKRWLVIWQPRQKEPLIIQCDGKIKSEIQRGH